MKINYDNPSTLVVTKLFDGETEEGKKFTITASWNEWDDWTIDSISWETEEGNNDEEAEISELFLTEING